MCLLVESFVLETPNSQLKVAAKRYSRAFATDQRGPTLLFAHCIGSHKEQWEPTIHAIYQIQSTKGAAHRIREAWAFDWQNHGDSALINRSALRDRPTGVSVYEWAAAIAHFVRSDHIKGHRIVPIGHSAGAGTMVLTTTHFPTSKSPYVAMILVEPTIVTKELFEATLDDRMAAMNFAVSSTTGRRDTWASRDDALAWLSKRYPWSTWNPSVVKLFTEHGLQDVSNGVSLKCDRKQEAASFPDTKGHFEAAILLGNICRNLPVHLIWGEREEIVPPIIQDSLCDVSQGREVASVSKIEEAGHMVVQEQPEALASAICQALDSIVPCYTAVKL